MTPEELARLTREHEATTFALRGGRDAGLGQDKNLRRLRRIHEELFAAVIGRQPTTDELETMEMR